MENHEGKDQLKVFIRDLKEFGFCKEYHILLFYQSE